MHHFTALAASLSLVAALVVPRATPPSGWQTSLLEPYDTYHTRYMALECNLKHNTAFFNQCCHPLLADETTEAFPAQCIPSTDNIDDDDDDCDGNDSEPTSTPTPTPAATPAAARPAVSTAPAPQKPATTPSSDGSSFFSGGFATYFYQNGVAGACGTVHSDNDMIAAIDANRYGNTGVESALCGQKVSITNTANHNNVIVTIADACPTCDNSNSIDLSLAAFQKLGPLSEGLLPITWSFV